MDAERARLARHLIRHDEPEAVLYYKGECAVLAGKLASCMRELQARQERDSYLENRIHELELELGTLKGVRGIL
jgi:hypothetical protein